VGLLESLIRSSLPFTRMRFANSTFIRSIFYSWRSATIGSTRVARLEGM
jgi:hypothetical protein